MTDPRQNISHLKNHISTIIGGIISNSIIIFVCILFIVGLFLLIDEYVVLGKIIGGLIFLSFIIIGRKELGALYKIKELLSKTETILSTDQDIDEILKIARDIHKSLSNKRIFQSYTKTYNQEQEYYQQVNQIAAKPKIIWTDIIAVYVAILSDLRSDLLRRIDETKSQLEQGKESIKNVEEITEVTGKHLLLQSTRLDRQIEQFEELQRVMMKV